ncbi:MAG: hypothetical protein O2820_25360 [Planctomycetota bacterium]|nr:hypothetical protein [Planctomycetota bacterium]
MTTILKIGLFARFYSGGSKLSLPPAVWNRAMQWPHEETVGELWTGIR